jgi:hypothetical protein
MGDKPMYRYLILALALGGCATTGFEPADDDTAFHKAAVSWVGAPIQEMLERWGEPSNLHVEASERRDGLARWRTSDDSAPRDDTGGVDTHSATCIAEARYDMAGVITKVDTVSSNCEKVFDEERLAQLTR